jgi:hypothetical protein
VTISTSARAVTRGWQRLQAPFQRRTVAYPASALVVLLTSVITIVMRRRVVSPLGLSPYDGLLYLRQAKAVGMHNWLDEYNNLTLVKVPGYSLFMAVCHWIGVSVKDAEQVVAILSAVLVGLCVLVVTKRLGWSVLVFLVCAFNPLYLSTWSADYGRDALFASIGLTVVTGLFLTSYFLIFGRAFGWALAAAGLSGLSLAAYVLVREEGVTVVPTALAAVGAVPLMYAVRHKPWRSAGVGRWLRQAARSTVPSALVLVLALGAPLGIVLYKNYKTYGVATTSELASGAFMDAYAQWERVEAGPAAFRIPISEAQREAVYEVSPTARRLAPSLEDKNNVWRFSGCYTVPNCDYAGGWMTWAIRDAAAAAGAFGSARESQAFFEKLAQEIADACDSGALTCKVKLPSAIQPLTRITVPNFVGAFARLSASILGSKAAFAHYNDPPNISPEYRAEFTDVAVEVPMTPEAGAAQASDYAAHSWEYQILAILYTTFFPALALLGLGLLLLLLASRRGRRSMGPLGALAVALLIGSVARIALISIVDAADYDADQPRYLYPAYTLLLAFGLVALIQGLTALDLKRVGALVRTREQDVPDVTLPGARRPLVGPGRIAVPRHQASPAWTDTFDLPVQAGSGDGPIRTREDELESAPWG